MMTTATKTATGYNDSEWKRFTHNMALGYAAIDAGIPLFVSDQSKHPLIICFNEDGDKMSAEERRKKIAANLEERRRNFMKANGREPVVGTDIREARFVGATRDKKTFKKMMMAYRGLQPVVSVSVQVAGLGVIDIDEYKYPGSIERITRLLEANGVDINSFPFNPTRRGGLHIYTRLETPAEGNSIKFEGAEWGDFKGKTQVVCVGTVLDGGGSYGTAKDLERLCAAFKAETIPPTPQPILDMLRNRSTATSTNSKSSEAEMLAELEVGETEDGREFGDLFGPPALDCPYDLDEMLARNPNFAKRYENPTASKSQNRMAAANFLLLIHPNMPPHHVKAFYLGWPDGTGEFVDSNSIAEGEWNDRQVVREVKKARGSLGKELGAVDEDEENVSPDVQAKWEEEAAERKAKAERLKGLDRETAELLEREQELTAAIAADESSAPDPQIESHTPAKAKRKKGPLSARGGELWCTFVAPEWAVYGMLPQVGTAMLYGDSNVGKTFLGLHLLDRVSRGKPFLGRRTRAADTLYVSSEGGGGLSGRMKALYDVEPFDNVADTIMVRSDLPEFDKSPENAAKKIKLMALEAQKDSGRGVGVIVLDNWVLMLGDHEENDNSFAAAVLKALSKVAEELGCLILILHHTDKGQNNYRGPSSIRAALDAMYGVKEVGKDVCEVKCSKLRDGPKPPVFRYKLRTVVVGENEHKDKVTSCVVIDYFVEAAAMGEVVDDATDDATMTPTDTPKDKMRGVLKALRTCIHRSAITTGDDPSEVGAPAGIVFNQLNVDRKAAGLDELKDRTAVPKFLAKLEVEGEVTRTGSGRTTEYRLA
jgi:hypothetical protein